MRNQSTQLVFALICLFVIFSQSLYSQDCPFASFECPLTISVCPGEEFKITQATPSLPALPQVASGGSASVYEQTNYDYSFDVYQEDVKICDDCHNEIYHVYTPTMYRVEISYNDNLMIFYVRAEIEECESNVDLIGDSFLLGDLSSEGNYGLSVKYKNNGPGYLINTDIVYEINGTIIDTFNFAGPTINPGQSRAIDIGSHYFVPNTEYTIKTWSTNPNEGTDLDVSNDTITRFYSTIYGEMDLVMDSFTSLTLPITTGNKTVSVRVQDLSNAPLSQYQIQWSVNGNLQNPYSVNNPTPNPEDYYYYFDLGNYDFDVNQDYEIKAWTVLPSGLIDTNPLNDTITLSYQAAAYDYYLADTYSEICPGDTKTFSINLFENYNYNCFDCDFSATVKWLIDGVVVLEKNYDNVLETCYESCYVSFSESFTSSFQTSALVEIQATAYSSCTSIFGCNGNGPTGASPPPSKHINKSFGVFVNDCGIGTTEPPVTTEPDCANNAGTMYFDYCDGGQQYFLIEMADGTIYDPYYGPGISFQHYDGQKINFDYTIAPFSTPCDLASAAITITCIEEVMTTTNPPNPTTGTNQIIDDYPWLNNLIDQNNCQGTTVNVFDLGSYAFVQIIDDNNATLYFQDGTYYCQDGNNLNCVQAYSLGSPTDTWTCGEITTPPNPPTTNNEVFANYSWLGNLVDQNNCDGTTVNVFDLGAYAFVQIIDNDNATLYFEDGTFYCQDGNNLNCMEAYSLGSPTDSWTCGISGPNPPTTTPAIFDKYPWLSNLYSSTDCNGSYESITEYDLGPYAFIYAQGNDFGMLYFEDGSPYCNNADFDCLDIYSLENPTDVTLCSMDKPAPAENGSETTISENAYKTPVEIVPIWLVYPNPTSGSFTIELDGQNNDLSLVSIYDIQGKVIEEVLLNGDQSTLNFNLEHLENGMYFVALQYGDKTEVKKLMIKK